MAERRRWFALGGLLLLHAVPFLVRPSLIGGDEPHFALAAHSLVAGGDFDLRDDYAEVAAGAAAAGHRFRGKALEPHLRQVGERVVVAHPQGLPLLVAPFLALQQAVAPGAAPDGVLLGLTLLVSFAGLLALRQLAGQLLPEAPRVAGALALAVYFSTPLWFASRTFFTEPWLVAAALLAAAALGRRQWLAGAVFLGLGLLLKETALVWTVPALVAVGLRAGWGNALRVALGPAVAGVLFVAKNMWLYGAPFVTYYAFEWGNPWRGAWGLLVDERHGLLPFAPLALVAALGFPEVLRRPREAGFWALTAAAGLFTLTACWPAWGGGSCYGPRLLLPALPVLLPLLAVAWRRYGQNRWFRRALVTAASLGAGLQAAAVANPFDAFWEPPAWQVLAGQPVAALACALLLAWWLIRRIPWGDTVPL